MTTDTLSKYLDGGLPERLKASLEEKLNLYQVVRSWSPNDEVALVIFKLLLEEEGHELAMPPHEPTYVRRYQPATQVQQSTSWAESAGYALPTVTEVPPEPIRLKRRIP